MGIRVAYSYPWYFSEQLWCIHYFNPTYDLKDIEFPNLIHFITFSEFLLLINYNIIHNSSLTGQTDRWDPSIRD